MDRIKINNLIVYTKNGYFKEERILGQKLGIDIELFLNLTKASFTDKLYNSINYMEVSKLVVNKLSKNSYKLIEKVANVLLNLIEDKFKKKLYKIKICIRKYNIPTNLNFNNIEIIMERKINFKK